MDRPFFIDHLFSSPEGDIPLGPEDLKRPFLLGPSKPHPVLTLKDYFQAIERFLLKDGGTWLIDVLKAATLGGPGVRNIRKIRIRSEKHGALYHIASVQILTDAPPVRIAIATAVSNGARACLHEEYDRLKSLERSHPFHCLPRAYGKGEVVCSKGHSRFETFTLMLSEWFEDYHEWHLSTDLSDQGRKIRIWDLEKGCRYATTGEAIEILRESSRILTLYYDPRTFRQIYPWRHAAGDFVVSTGGAIQVRLTTVRGFRSVLNLLSDGAVDPLIALAYFFLDLTIGMRLDRLNGVGDIVWIPNFAVQATVAGFMEALPIMADRGLITMEAIGRFQSLLHSLDQDDLKRLFQPLSVFYEEEMPDESPVIQAHLTAHIHLLHQALRKFPE